MVLRVKGQNMLFKTNDDDDDDDKDLGFQIRLSASHLDNYVFYTKLA